MSNEPNIAVAVVVVVVTLARCCLLDIIDPHVAHTHSVVGMLTGGGDELRPVLSRPFGCQTSQPPQLSGTGCLV